MVIDDERTERTEPIAPVSAETEAVLAELGGIRQSIDNIDAALVHLLAERFKFTQKVGKLKAKHGLPPADLARESRQIQRLRGLAIDAALDPSFAEKWFNFVVAEVIHHHERLVGEEGDGRTTEQRPEIAAVDTAELDPATSDSAAPDGAAGAASVANPVANPVANWDADPDADSR